MPTGAPRDIQVVGRRSETAGARSSRNSSGSGTVSGAITSTGELSSHACAIAPKAIWMPAALRLAMAVHTPILLPHVTREKASATATPKRSSPIM